MQQQTLRVFIRRPVELRLVVIRAQQRRETVGQALACEPFGRRELVLERLHARRHGKCGFALLNALCVDLAQAVCDQLI